MWLDLLIRDPLTQFIAQVVAIIVVSRMLGLLTRAIGQPMVVAEITAGIVLGPSLLGWIFPETSGALFAPESLQSLSLVSQLGLILFMFLVGLELDPKLLAGRARTAMIISQVGIIVPFGLGALIALYLHPRFSGESVSSPIFALFFGAAVSTTAFPVLARILSERRLLRSRVGALTIACAAVEDVLAWCLLAFVVAAARATGLQTAMVTTALAAGYILVMLWGVRPLLARLGARVARREQLSQDIAALIMLLLFLSSWATELIGIHALFGAFLMGAILPKHGGLAHALAEKLEEVVLIVLLPLFFAYSGMRTEIGLLDTPSAWLALALIVLVACAGKLGASALAARMTGLSWRESGALGLLMNTRGLMGLIVLNIGLDRGVVSPTIFTMMVLMALFTTFITTPALNVVYPPEQLERDLLREAEPPAPAKASGSGVLVCVANDSSGPGLVAMAGLLAPGAHIHALHLVEPTDRVSFHLDQVDDDDQDLGLRGLLERARELGLHVSPMSFVSSETADEIVSIAEVKDVDLVLVGLPRPFLGDVVHHVMRDATCEVAAFADRRTEAIRRVVAPMCGSPHDQAALRLAKRLEAAGAQLTILDTSPSVQELQSGYDLAVVGLGSEEELRRLMDETSVSLLVVRGQLEPVRRVLEMRIHATGS
jgi:Kef-type K+ transport system membrane component KefB/nucleotide-binding universal stress UspA family protein